MKSSSQRRDWTNIFGVKELPVYLILSSVREANGDYKKYLHKMRISLIKKVSTMI